MKLFKKPIFVSVSPNAERDDVWRAFAFLLTPWRWVKGGAPESFTQALKKYLGIEYLFLFDSGRTSLYALLRAMEIREGDEVLVQAFTCTAAVNPILWVGAQPIYVDIEEDTCNMSPRDLLRKISSRSKIVIVQHTFGLPAHIDEICEIARKNNLIVIEDVAHAFGAEWKGKKLGTFGDAAVLSFGRYKIISSVFGGAAAVRNPEIAKHLEAFYASRPYPSRFWIFEQLFHPVFLCVAKPLYNILSIGKAAVVIAKKLKLLSLSVYAEEKLGGRPGFGPSRLPNALAALGLHQLEKLERFNAHRAELARIYMEQFQKESEIGTPRVFPDADPAYLYFPIFLKDTRTASRLICEGRVEEGMYLENWPSRKVIGPRGTHLDKLKYQEGSCPVAEAAALRIVTLPTNPTTSESDARRVSAFIKNFLRTIPHGTA